jgi:hypothetical protein
MQTIKINPNKICLKQKYLCRIDGSEIKLDFLGTILFELGHVLHDKCRFPSELDSPILPFTSVTNRGLIDTEITAKLINCYTQSIDCQINLANKLLNPHSIKLETID